RALLETQGLPWRSDLLSSRSGDDGLVPTDRIPSSRSRASPRTTSHDGRASLHGSLSSLPAPLPDHRKGWMGPCASDRRRVFVHTSAGVLRYTPVAAAALSIGA